MNPQDAYDAWAPERSPWAAWAKPVLFWAKADTPPTTPPSTPPATPESRFEVPPLREGAALVVNLPGALGVAYGLAAARAGYRPVPLYNCGVGPQPLVETEPIRRALLGGAAELAALGLPNDAPPAFLLDSKRRAPSGTREPGRFDNRWIVFPQDFPSASFLKSRGLGRVVLVQSGSMLVDDDLAHVLVRWQEAGIEIRVLDLKAGRPPRPLLVNKPSGFRSLWYGVLAAAGLLRGAAGGFGAIIPHTSSGG